MPVSDFIGDRRISLLPGERAQYNHGMRTPILCALLAGTTLSWSASYHFAADGDDARSAAQARSAATPWKSLSKISSLTLSAGDSILLRKGDVWREPLVLKQSGVRFNPILVASYGTAAALPEIRGTIEVQGTSDGTLWSASIASGTSVGSVFLDGIPLPISRYPDTGWMVASAVSGLTGITSPALAAQDWTGASVHLRTAMWTLETNRIATQSGSQVTFAKNTVYGPPAGVSFFLTNHPNAMGATPSWSFSATAQTLRWKASGGKVEAATVPTLVNLMGASFVRIQGLRLFGATLQGIKANGTAIEVYDNEILYPGMFGVYMGSGREADISGNRIVGAGNDALFLNGPRNSAQRNNIRRSAVTPFLTPEGMGDGCCGGYGILVQGDSARILRNNIDSTGYNGIGFGGIHSTVDENDVAHSCMTTDDCAGIYTIGGYVGNSYKIGSTGSTVRRNIVRDVVGALGGWAKAKPASQGIYLDDGSQHIRVDSNVVTNATNGIFLHNTQNVLVRGNVLYGNHISPILLYHDGLAGPSDMKDNLIDGNLLVGLLGQGQFSDGSIIQPQTMPLASFERNTSCFDHLLYSECRLSNRLVWSRFAYDTSASPFGPETQKSGSFDTTVWGWSASAWQVKLTRDSGSLCFRKGCLQVNSVGASDNTFQVYGNVVPVKKDQLYRLTFLAKGKRFGLRLTPTLRHARNSWEAMGYSSGLSLDTAWSRYEVYMRATETEDTARIDFMTQSIDSGYWLDEVSFRSVPETMLQGLSPSRLLVNSSPLPGTGSPLSGNWMNASGQALAASPSLSPWQGLVAFPYQGWLPIGLEQAKPPALRATRSGHSWLLQGLQGPATIVDARGRLLARLEPDAQGSATWTAPNGARLCFLNASGRSQVLVTP